MRKSFSKSSVCLPFPRPKLISESPTGDEATAVEKEILEGSDRNEGALTTFFFFLKVRPQENRVCLFLRKFCSAGPLVSQAWQFGLASQELWFKDLLRPIFHLPPNI